MGKTSTFLQEAFENVGMSMFGYMTDIEKVIYFST